MINISHNYLNNYFKEYALENESFCKRAHSHHSVTKDELDYVLQAPRVNLSHSIQDQSSFLSVLPEESINHIFTYLNQEGLSSCLLACKQLHRIATPLFTSQVLPHILKEFKKLEEQINLQLANFNSQLRFNFTLIGEEVRVTSSPISFPANSSYLVKLENANKKISAFKAYCVFHANNVKDNEEIRQILCDTLRLQKACQFYLENAPTRENRGVAIQSRNVKKKIISLIRSIF